MGAPRWGDKIFPAMTSHVYIITNKLSGKHYVGKANDYGARWALHLTDSRKFRPRTYVGAAIKLHGSCNFSFSVLEVCVTEEQAYEREVYWISQFRSNEKGLGYNLESGGRGGKRASCETRAKHSEALLRRPVEERKAFGQFQKGKPKSSEHRTKLSVANKGKHSGPSTREHMEKIGQAERGSKHHNYRHDVSDAAVTQLKVSGKSNRQIAAELRVSPHCVRDRLLKSSESKRG